MTEGPEGAPAKAGGSGRRNPPPVEVRVAAEIRLWGQTVGAVAELGDGRIYFEYASAFRRSGLEISPIHLPLELEGSATFPELARLPAFEGLPGVIADALPDRFGNQVIESYYKSVGRAGEELSSVQKMLYVGERALGALTFNPSEEVVRNPPVQEALEIQDLVRDARRIVEGDAEVAVPEIYRIGASAGGMRPKALVLYDPHRRILRSGYAKPFADDLPCIVKFDGVGDGASPDQLGSPQPFNRVEAAYMRMARAAGLNVAEVEILETGEHAHLLVRRFDLQNGSRIHQHTLGGLLHIDYNMPGASSYEEFLRTILRLGLPPADIREGFRRMVFNVLAVNQDDHVKNLSFHMDRNGEWSLAPAYDLTFAKGAGFTRQHQMLVAGKASGITREDLLGVGEFFSVKQPHEILEEVGDVLADWEGYARDAGVPDETVRQVGHTLEERRREVT